MTTTNLIIAAIVICLAGFIHGYRREQKARRRHKPLHRIIIHAAPEDEAAAIKLGIDLALSQRQR